MNCKCWTLFFRPFLLPSSYGQPWVGQLLWGVGMDRFDSSCSSVTTLSFVRRWTSEREGYKEAESVLNRAFPSSGPAKPQ